MALLGGDGIQGDSAGTADLLCCVDSCRRPLHSFRLWTPTLSVRSGSCLSGRDTHTLKAHQATDKSVWRECQHEMRPLCLLNDFLDGGSGGYRGRLLTLAGVRLPTAAIGRFPGPVVIEGSTPFTVLSRGVVRAHTPAIHLS